MEKNKFYSRLKGFFLLVLTMLSSIKAGAAMPAKYIIKEQEEQKNKEIERIKKNACNVKYPKSINKRDNLSKSTKLNVNNLNYKS